MNKIVKNTETKVLEHILRATGKEQNRRNNVEQHMIFTDLRITNTVYFMSSR